MIGPKIAVAFDRYGGWHERFLDALASQRARHGGFDAAVVNLDGHDWIERVRPFDAVLWKSSVMGAAAAAHFKEKIYFLESQLGKLVFPSFKTVWHFESKVAQSYLFAHAAAPTPKTVATFDYEDAERCLDRFEPPFVFKTSAGAGSEGVRLVRTRDAARQILQGVFAQELWTRARGPSFGRRAKIRAAISGLTAPWLRQRIVDHVLKSEIFKPAYWQELITDNTADLRITVIGGRYAVAFFRRNRPGDFRASGSGDIDYEREVPRDALDRAFAVSRALELDTVAFDLLFRGTEPVFVEMSYGYLASAIAEAPGMYERGDDGQLVFRTGSWWPQELWARSLLTKLGVS